MNHMTLFDYYDREFAMVHNHKYSRRELEEMIPFELDLYSDKILQQIENKKNAENFLG